MAYIGLRIAPPSAHTMTRVIQLKPRDSKISSPDASPRKGPDMVDIDTDYVVVPRSDELPATFAKTNMAIANGF